MQERHLWADVLRVLAMASVVIVHVAADIITEWRSVPGSWWWAANFYDSISRGGVAIFVMLSGAFLLSQTEGTRDFFRKRLKRIAIPFIIWVVFYLLWRKCFYQPDMGVREAVRRAANNDVHFHLWFLYMISGLYLMVPLLRIFTEHSTRRQMLYFLGLCFLIASLAPFWEGLDALIFHTGIRWRIPVEAAQGFIGYFLLGYFLSRESRPAYGEGALGFWVVSFLVCFLGSGWVALRCNKFPILFYDNMAPNVVGYAASSFIIIKELMPRLWKKPAPGAERLLLSLSEASFGIYLIHPVFIDIFNNGRLGVVIKPALLGHPAWSIPVTAALIYLCSYVTVLGIKKVPGLKYSV